jgi:predicted tellurium resistance membrane protein TerC
MLELLLDPGIWAALVTLTLLEIVLGIDNLIVISILTGTLPRPEQSSSRRIGLGVALITRIALLSLVFMVAQLEAPLFSVRGLSISWRDILLIGMALIGEGFDLEIPKGYLYFAMAFSFFIELINLRMRHNTSSSAPSLSPSLQSLFSDKLLAASLRQVIRPKNGLMAIVAGREQAVIIKYLP